MSDDNFGQWGTISFTIPDFLKEVRDAVNDFAELLITFLEIANLALEFVKAFIKAFLDPLVALIEAIIAEILALLRSLKDIGLYITGDWALLGWPPEDLRGGYMGFERRMIARLTDHTDPTRPDAPSTTKVLGLFGYVSVDPSDFERLINFIITIMRLFGLSFFPDTSRLPVPTIKTVTYGAQALAVGGAFQFQPLSKALGSWNGTPPQKARVVWETQPASQKYPLNPFPMLGPSGYLVTVSTFQDGLPLKFSRVRANTDKKPANGDKNKLVQPREYGVVRDINGQPIVLHGGAEMLSFKGSPFEYNKGMASNEVPKDGVCQVFATLNPTSNDVVPLESLGRQGEPGTLGTPGDGKGKDFFFQRTFLITDGVTLAQWFAGEYSAVFDLEDLPHQGELTRTADGQVLIHDLGPAGTYYFRVWSTGKQVAEKKAVPKWDFKQPKFQASTPGQPFTVNLLSGSASIGNPSGARKATFVGQNTQEYMKALETALLMLVLTRADMPTLDQIGSKTEETKALYREGKLFAQGFALTPSGLEDAAHLLKRMYPDPSVLEVAGQDPIKWRGELYHRIKVLAQDLYEQSGFNPRVEKAVVEGSKQLRALTVADLTDSGFPEAWSAFESGAGVETPPLLMEYLNPDNPVATRLDYGFAPNIYSTGIPSASVEELFFTPSMLDGRDPFLLYDQSGLDIPGSIPADQVTTTLSALPASVRKVYEKFIQEDGSILVPEQFREYLREKTSQKRATSSGDLTPVLVVNRDPLLSWKRDRELLVDSGIFYTRGALQEVGVVQAQVGDLVSPYLTEAAMVLRVAAAVRPVADGEWIAIRIFDTWPELEEFLRALENWVKALAEALKSIADAIIRYIEFLQAQIVELQQLIRRINALIQSFLNFAFALPQFSGLMLLSDGTDGILADLVAAQNKPSDSPLAYGGGVAILAPFAPGFLFDLISLATGDGEGQDLDKKTTVQQPPDAVGTEAVQPAQSAPTDEPDVL